MARQTRSSLESERRRNCGSITAKDRSRRHGCFATGSNELASCTDASLIEVGAGIASLTFELLTLGVKRALVVDAFAPAYLAVAAEEASQRQVTDVVRFVHADFAESARPFPPASIIALDRVVCCYPSYRLLLEQATRRADRALALSYPRDRWFVRARVWVENATRKTGFETFVHPVDDMMRVIEHGGFEPVSAQSTLMWSADVFARKT